MNKLSTKNEIPIPEFEPFRALDITSPDMLDDNTRQIQIAARMQQIIAEPVVAKPVPAKQFARARWIAIATAATLAVGLGGATAATAAGFSNPVGDWVYEMFPFTTVLSTEEFPEQTIEFVDTAPDGTPNPVEYQIPGMTCSVGVSVAAIRMPDWELIYPVDEISDNPDFILATQLLSGIDFTTLGVPLPEMETGVNELGGFSVSVAREENPGAFDNAVRIAFQALLAEHGWEIERYVAFPPGNHEIGYDISQDLACG